MDSSDNNSAKGNLRKKAEGLLENKEAKPNSQLTESETLKLVYELQVHKIELELQDEELIQAKKQTELATDKYIELFDFAPSGYFSLSKNGLIIDLNFVGAKMLGKERSCLRNKLFALFVTNDSKQIFHFFLENLIKSNISQTCEINLLNDNKLPMCVYLTGISKENDNHSFVTSVDITQRKQAEEALQQKTTLFETLLNTTIDGILIIDRNGRKVFQNEKTVELFNIPREFSDNIKDQDQLNYVVNANKNPEQFARKVYYLYDHPEETSEDVLELKSGKILHRYSAPVVSKDKHNYGRIWIFRDITDSKQAEKALIVAKEKAEESDRLKTAFLQNMSHEIRTPMNAIKGFSQLLVKNHYDESKIQKYTGIIDQRCNDLLDIIDDLLDIAKIESQQLQVNLEECNLNLLFKELTIQFEEYQRRKSKQHIQFSFQPFCNASGTLIITDEAKLKQIFINLLTNAFKFTNNGIIEGGCKLKNNKLIFYVSDTGIGIPANKQKEIFDRFAQLRQHENMAIGGIGLGLSITKGLVSLLGGEIFLESAPGKGSTFSFTFPCKIAQPTQKLPVVAKESEVNNFSDKTILLVEDDSCIVEYIKEIIFDTGINLILAKTGNEAIQIAVSQSFDLVLMDIRLPDIDGYKAAKQIKLHNPALIIIAQTAYASVNDKQKALDAGFDDYISKPVEIEMLLTLLNKYLSKN